MATVLPSSIHIAIVVFGPAYTDLLIDITLPNLAEMVLEIPLELRDSSLVRILTTELDKITIERSASLRLLRTRIRVEVMSGARLVGYEEYSQYGPMVEGQRLLVIDAARANAALFFVGPDQIYNRGSFALFVDCLRCGYRLIVGPGPRVNREATRSELRHVIAASPEGGFALSSEQQIDMFFRHWHRINDQFLIENPESIWWKAYVCHRPHPDELLFRLFQGPTFVAWPRFPMDNFNGFADRQLPDLCCTDWREIYVVEDGTECLALDLTDDERFEQVEPASFPRVSLLYSFFQRRMIKDLKLLYGLRTCRVHRGERDAASVARWMRDFDRIVDPLLALALAERWIRRRLGKWPAAVFRIVCMLNTHTFSFILGPFTPRLLRKWKANEPPRPPASPGHEPDGREVVATN